MVKSFLCQESETDNKREVRKVSSAVDCKSKYASSRLHDWHKNIESKDTRQAGEG